MLPQQAICEDSTGGKIKKIRLQGLVDTACQFVKSSAETLTTLCLLVWTGNANYLYIYKDFHHIFTDDIV